MRHGRAGCSPCAAPSEGGDAGTSTPAATPSRPCRQPTICGSVITRSGWSRRSSWCLARASSRSASWRPAIAIRPCPSQRRRSPPTRCCRHSWPVDQPCARPRPGRTSRRARRFVHATSIRLGIRACRATCVGGVARSSAITVRTYFPIRTRSSRARTRNSSTRCDSRRASCGARRPTPPTPSTSISGKITSAPSAPSKRTHSRPLMKRSGRDARGSGKPGRNAP